MGLELDTLGSGLAPLLIAWVLQRDCILGLAGSGGREWENYLW